VQEGVTHGRNAVSPAPLILGIFSKYSLNLRCRLTRHYRATSQRSEVRGQRSEVRGQRAEVRGQRSEVRGQRPEGITSVLIG